MQRPVPAGARTGTHVLPDVVGVALVVKLRPLVYVVTVMTSPDIVFVADPGSAGADVGAERCRVRAAWVASRAGRCSGAARRAHIPR